MPVNREVKIVGFYRYVSKTGKTAKWLIRRELQDSQTGEVLRTGIRSAYLWKYARKNGWQIEGHLA